MRRQSLSPIVNIDSPIAALNSALPMLSLSATVELAWLIGGARRIVRLTSGAGQADALANGVRACGLFAEVWDRRLRPVLHPGLQGYATGGAVVTPTDNPRDLAVVFVAHAIDDIRTAIAAQTMLDDAAIGAVLDYPECCVRNYIANRAAFNRGFAPLFEAQAGSWPWWSNALLASFGYLAVSHLPCAPNCKPTGTRAAAHWAALETFDLPFARFAQSKLASLVVWDPHLGIAAATTTPSPRWIACAGMRPHVNNGSLTVDSTIARHARWIDHRGPA